MQNNRNIKNKTKQKFKQNRVLPFLHVNRTQGADNEGLVQGLPPIIKVPAS